MGRFKIISFSNLPDWQIEELRSLQELQVPITIRACVAASISEKSAARVVSWDASSFSPNSRCISSMTKTAYRCSLRLLKVFRTYSSAPPTTRLNNWVADIVWKQIFYSPSIYYRERSSLSLFMNVVLPVPVGPPIIMPRIDPSLTLASFYRSLKFYHTSFLKLLYSSLSPQYWEADVSNMPLPSLLALSKVNITLIWPLTTKVSIFSLASLGCTLGLTISLTSRTYRTSCLPNTVAQMGSLRLILFFCTSLAFTQWASRGISRGTCCRWAGISKVTYAAVGTMLRYQVDWGYLGFGLSLSFWERCAIVGNLIIHDSIKHSIVYGWVYNYNSKITITITVITSTPQLQTASMTAITTMTPQLADYRNCRYQGQLATNLNGNLVPHGHGVLIDYHYTWVVSQWRDGSVGSWFGTVFGDSHKLYQWQARGTTVTVYEGRGYKLYKTKQVLVMDMQECNHTYNGTLAKYKCKQSKQKLELELVCQQQYHSQASMSQISQLLQISMVYSTFQHFIRDHFPVLLPSVPCRSSTTSLGYPNTEHSITLKLSHKLNSRVTKVHYSQQLYKQCAYYVDGEGCAVEEGINAGISCYVQYQWASGQQEVGLLGRQGRQVQQECVRNLVEFYKRSLFFTNQFISLSSIYGTRAMFHLLMQQAINGRSNLMTRHIDDDVDHSHAYYQASVEDIKREIARTEEIGRSRSKSRAIAKTNGRSRVAVGGTEMNDSMFNLRSQVRPEITSKASRYEYVYEKPTPYSTRQETRSPTPRAQHNFPKSSTYDEKQNRSDMPYFESIKYTPPSHLCQIDRPPLPQSSHSSGHRNYHNNNSNTLYLDAWRSKQPLQVLAMDYQEIQQEIVQYSKQKEKEKVASTKHTTPRNNPNPNHNNSKSNSNRNISASRSRSRSNNKSRSKSKQTKKTNKRPNIQPYCTQGSYLRQQQEKVSKVMAYYGHTGKYCNKYIK